MTGLIARVADAGTVEAHGVGGQADLPIPLELAVSGAVAALVVSFTVLIVAWRTPRYESAERPARVTAPELLGRLVQSSYWTVGLRVLGLAVALLAVAAAVGGKNELTNPFFGIVYVWWWVGVPFLSILFGPVWRAISPMRTVNLLLARLAGSDADRGIRDYPAWLGYWPAAAGLYAFVWLELASKSPAELGSVRLWCAVYVAVMLVGGAVWGNRFYEHADPFEVYSSLVGRLSPWSLEEPPEGTDGGRRLVLRSPLANLARVPAMPGLVAVVAVLFGSTAFDSFSESSYWVSTVQEASLTKVTLDNLALAGFCLAAGLLFSVGCMLTGVGPEQSRPELPRRLAHSIVPIVAAYVVAHYLTLFVDAGIQTLALASDPFGEGWNLFGTAALSPTYWFSLHPSVLATIKVVTVVVGHVAAAVVAHDRAIALLPKRLQVTGQLPLLVVMISFTAGGLYLLFSA